MAHLSLPASVAPPSYVLGSATDPPYNTNICTLKKILLDTDTTLELHPLLQSIRPIDSNELIQHEGTSYHTQEFEFVDQIRCMGLFTMQSKYMGRVSAAHDTHSNC